MKNKIIPVYLSQIFLSVPEPVVKTTRCALKKMAFDSRHDFLLLESNSKLAVAAFFLNEKLLKSSDARGFSRRVMFCLVDNTLGRTIASDAVSVYLNAGQTGTTVRTYLDIDYKSIDFSHEYAVEVCDDKTGVVLGIRGVHFFSADYGGNDISDYFEPLSGGVVLSRQLPMLKAFNAENLTYYHAMFYFSPANWNEAPAFIPEMEVRLYYPDGTIETKFAQPELAADACPEPFYCVDVPFFITSRKRGICYAELVVLDFAIAGFVFNSDSEEEMTGNWLGPNLHILYDYTLEAATTRFRKYMDSEDTTDDDDSNEIDEDCCERLLEEFSQTTEHDGGNEAEKSITTALQNLTGLKSVKGKLETYEKLMLFNKMRNGNGLPTMSLPLHAMFWGAPGTGKTTVAKRMGMMLRRVGALSKGHVVVKERANLLGPNYSMEETNTLQAIEEAQGGILFIDEAYQLYQPNDPRDPGKFVIETLLTALADESKRDWMLILAGYTDEMKRMFEMNPGFKSRIPESNIYIFEDFSENELLEIAERYLERNDYSLSPEAKTSLAMRLGDDFRHRDRNFGNARHVINLIQTEILPSMASRVVGLINPNPENLSLIHSCDIPQPRNLVKNNRPKIGYCA